MWVGVGVGVGVGLGIGVWVGVDVAVAVAGAASSNCFTSIGYLCSLFICIAYCRAKIDKRETL